ncbi:DUF2851 family protein [Cyclobacterium qasimii]|uniref:DUF2851 domain-containing protein n=2 Tax=Cyclobacterium qasimii TaxID=1350429 RepID=S7WGD2_9BACT|nr:DUF2851 family protein [Cyclobacterium qasimii]EPR65819.1 hypothetical protein ADICYQ_5167 [Cyclobacterium qasimii M12-11B]GEO23256.1 hypothetical protein CQA01_37900 [Cyclobacterium qasimii]
MFRFQEDFLQLIWKYQYFDKNALETEGGAPLLIHKIGFHNHHEGPDFKEAEISLSGIRHFGHVEIHLRTSDWKSHHHQTDHAYNAVVLHVVWQHDVEVKRKDGTLIPTLVLDGKVPLDVIRNYQKLQSSPKRLLCTDSLPSTPEILKFSMLEKALVERLQEKSDRVLELLKENENDWEETAYQWLFYSFGFKTNSLPMLKLAQSLPYKLIKKNAGNLMQIEAMIFGQAGMFTNTLDLIPGYEKNLKYEYAYLQKKYSLKRNLFPSEWKFMKVRPSNFPSFRLAQLANLLNRSPHLFDSVLHELDSSRSFERMFDLSVSNYWKKHYHFGKPNMRATKGTLSSGIMNLLAINFIVPLWYAYGRYTDLSVWQEKCFNLLQEIPAEKNSLISIYQEVDWSAVNAFDSQGMLGLYHQYCHKRMCLQCKIGQNLLRPNLK